MPLAGPTEWSGNNEAISAPNIASAAPAGLHWRHPQGHHCRTPMKQALQLKLGQQLTMTPQLQQAIKLLQLSTLDLQMEIQQVLQSNPLLEVDEGDEAPGAEGEQDEREPLAQASEGPMEH